MSTREECPVCGADIGPSKTFPWHYQHEDCRAIRQPRTMNRKEQAAAIAAATESAYMAYAYGEGARREIARFLLSNGHTPRQAEAIIKSKHLRWSDDAFGAGAGRPQSSTAFKTYYNEACGHGVDWIDEARMLVSDGWPTELPDELASVGEGEEQ